MMAWPWLPLVLENVLRWGRTRNNKKKLEQAPAPASKCNREQYCRIGEVNELASELTPILKNSENTEKVVHAANCSMT